MYDVNKLDELNEQEPSFINEYALLDFLGA